MIKVAIFASGSGSNAENLVQYFSKNNDVKIVSIYCNNPQAFVIERAKKFNLPCHIFNKQEFVDEGKVSGLLAEENIDFIILAGFLWLIPKWLVAKYQSKIINIHPALLPKYGGKGMYGHFVHEAVKKNNDSESGITIHFVNEHYDEGAVIFQASVTLDSTDTPDTIAQKVHGLEYEYFPQVAENVIHKIFKS